MKLKRYESIFREQEEWGVRWSEFDRNDRRISKQKIFKTRQQRDKFADKLEQKNNFAGFLSWLNPKE